MKLFRVTPSGERELPPAELPVAPPPVEVTEITVKVVLAIPCDLSAMTRAFKTGLFLELLGQHRGNVSSACRALGMHRTSGYRIVRRLQREKRAAAAVASHN